MSFKNGTCIYTSQRWEVLVRDTVHKLTVYKHSKSGTRPLNLSISFMLFYSLSLVWHKAISNGGYICLCIMFGFHYFLYPGKSGTRSKTVETADQFMFSLSKISCLNFSLSTGLAQGYLKALHHLRLHFVSDS